MTENTSLRHQTKPQSDLIVTFAKWESKSHPNNITFIKKEIMYKILESFHSPKSTKSCFFRNKGPSSRKSRLSPS